MLTLDSQRKLLFQNSVGVKYDRSVQNIQSITYIFLGVLWRQLWALQPHKQQLTQAKQKLTTVHSGFTNHLNFS